MDPELKESVEAFENLFDTSVEKLLAKISMVMCVKSKSFRTINRQSSTRVRYWLLCGLKVAVDRKLLPLAMEIANDQR
jgi:hypothetical protein